jgi:hypothetical protein
MTDGLLAVAAVVALSMTVFVPVVFDDTVLELLDTVFELLETVLELLDTVLLTVEFVTVSVAEDEDAEMTSPANAKNNGHALSVSAIFLPCRFRVAG